MQKYKVGVKKRNYPKRSTIIKIDGTTGNRTDVKVENAEEGTEEAQESEDEQGQNENRREEQVSFCSYFSDLNSGVSLIFVGLFNTNEFSRLHT